ncbi:MAG: hypothetical protein STHCBS139747_007906 [Sporothrix thermara]
MELEVVPYDIDYAHLGFGDLPIRNSPLRRILVCLAWTVSARIVNRRQPPSSLYTPLTRKWVVKRDRFGHLTEGKTLQYVAAYTNVPVPRVYTSFIHRGASYLVMERPCGITLAEAYRTYPRDDINAILFQLRLMINDLRSIRLPADAVVGVISCAGGSLRSARQPRRAARYGPFATIEDFHWWMRSDFHPGMVEQPPFVSEADWDDVEEMVELQDEVCQRPVFTHGNLQPENIIVSGRKVVSIVGWENAGWFPDYWEYTTAWTGCHRHSMWKSELWRFLDTYPDELFMEQTRIKWWGTY